MDDYPHWHDLDAADRLFLAALEAQLAGVPWRYVEGICEAADALEARANGTERPLGRGEAADTNRLSVLAPWSEKDYEIP